MIVVPNPEIIQTEDWRNPNSPAEVTPVFLIHDGGGTTFAYHCLSPLNRLVYGIHNPYFRSGQVFNGGIPQMARLYASWIKRTVGARGFPLKTRNADGTVSVLLGGWSLGGFLSLEIARRLAGDSVVRVVGILMVDSVYPSQADKKDLIGAGIVSEGEDGPEGDKQRLRGLDGRGEGEGEGEGEGDDATVSVSASASASALVPLSMSSREKNLWLSQRCMANAVQMLSRWSIPQWNGGGGGNKRAGRRPRAILLRAKQAVPTPDGKPALGVDRHRGERSLGWDAYAEDMFEQVVDVEGHHFDMFAPQRIEGISGSMRRALEKLDALAEEDA